MKKFLFLCAVLLGAFSMSQAQNTWTKASWVSWNLDTLKFSGTDSLGSAYGESKTVASSANRIILFEIQVATKHETPASMGLTLWGSMDNAKWYRVNLNSGTSPSAAYVTKSPLYSYSGTWPSITQPALAIGYLGTAAAWTAADTIAVGSGLSAGKAVTYMVTLVNPVFTYYKWGVSAQGSANTNAKVSSASFRYYLRNPY